ncbi:MAG: LacI family transcriptional regulator, partial [Clostridium sp.]|nr:LacI family transcriptional regulator [Clostridium sp.]
AAQLLVEKIDCDNKFSKRIILNNSLVERETVISI